MINVMSSGHEVERCLDSQLWHACAGGMVQMPPVDSKVFYFPQGHAEHAHKTLDLGGIPTIQPLVLCRVGSIRYLADFETDEVYARIRLVPLRGDGFDVDNDVGFHGFDKNDNQEKPNSFAKTLTQSDANNGGGFSVPRYCAETIFPRLDYTAEPPVQTILAKDVHGETWKFRHIYRGTPRRHLLTTGWSNFVNKKKLVAGDSIVFLRAENGELFVGIRRVKRGIGYGPEAATSGWNTGFFSEDENKFMRNGVRGRSKIRDESVLEAARLAARGHPFEVVYYPRASTPEFVVKASGVRAAMRIQWCPGMRFKMPFETEDSSRISWFMGTISSVQVHDPAHWPNSPWRLLQVAWDEPDLLQNVKRVSPWLVELVSVSNIPPIHSSPFSPPRKKLRLLPQPLEFSVGSLHSSSPLSCVSDNIPADIQGARQAHIFGQRGLFPFGLTLSHSGSSEKDEISNLKEKKPRRLMLFGKEILTEEEMCCSEETFGHSSSYGVFSWNKDEPFSEFMKNARRLTNLSDSSSNNMGR